MRGVPVRIEIGPKDIEKQQVVLVSRLDRKKSFVPWSSLAEELPRLLERIQCELYSRALAFRDANSRQANTYTELLEAMAGSRGFIRCGWCGSPDCEAKVKADTSATIRVILDEPDPRAGQCVVCSKKAQHTVVFAKSY
jgi:prolyl-tRNA synthetase